MGATRQVEVVPPTGERKGPDTRRPGRMKNSLRRGGRWVLLVAFLGLLFAAPVVPRTGTAWAKPYPIEPGPEPTNGDPTGDDRPNPTPKSVRRASSVHGRSALKIRDGRVVGASLGAWSWYLRHLAAIALR